MSLFRVYPESNLKIKNSESDDKVGKKSKLGTFLKQYSTIWNGLRCIFAIVCFLWFGYNAMEIIKQFREYNTIVMLRYELPNQTDLPAFTICGNCIIFSDDLRTKYDDYKTRELKLNNSPSDDDRRSEMREEFADKALRDFTALDIFENKSIQLKSLVTDCYFKPESIRDVNSSSLNVNCERIAKVVPSIYEGRKCFTYFSQLNNTDQENMDIKMEYERNPIIHFEISSEHRNWPVGRIQNATIIVAIHSPSVIPTNLDLGYYRIYPKKFYDFRFTKKISYLKPAPFKTNCKDYLRDNPKGERSRGDCINNCIKRETFGIWNCSNYYGIVTEDLLLSGEKICEKKFQSYMNYTTARKKCYNQCQLSCTEESYEISYAAEISNEDSENAIIEIKSDSTPYTFVHHKEELGEAEFIGTLGGHAHIWLGLSAVKLFNLIVHFLNSFRHVLCS